MHISFTGYTKVKMRLQTNGLTGVPTMNISIRTKSESEGKKAKRSLLDKIGGQEIGTSEKQIKTTAKRFFIIICLISTLATGLLCPVATSVYAEAVPPLPDGFNDIDLSDILITFPAGAGAGIKNNTVLTDIYNGYGSQGWGVADMTPYFDIVVSATGESAGLSNDVLNQHLGDNDWFTENGYDVKVNYDNFKTKLDNTETLLQYGANYLHQATLSPSTGNPWEWDWSSILEEYFKTGLIAFEHVFIDFDTLNDIAITMDDVLQNVYDFWTPNIESGVSINANLDDTLATGGQIVVLDATLNSNPVNRGRNFYFPKNVICAYSNSTLKLFYRNFGADTTFTVTSKENPSSNPVTYQCRGYRIDSLNTFRKDLVIEYNIDIPVFESDIATENYLNSLDEMPYLYSPDIINPQGNISIEDFPTMSPSIEQGQAIRPIPQEAYENWARTNNLQDPAENGALMGALVTPYIETEPAPAPSPAPDDPWADPVPDTEPANRPVSPTQPDMPEEPELTDEQINESLLGATPDLTEIFPFCIPWDIARIFKQFTATRKAPYIEWTFESELFGFEYTFELDMAIFDDVAVILRLLELIAFILGLAIATRYLIGAN